MQAVEGEQSSTPTGTEAADALRHPLETAQRVGDEYEGGADRPLAGYLGALAAYGTVVAGLVTAARVRRQPLPDHIGARDLVTVGVATHKLSRMIAKDPVTSPLRAPFMRFEGQAGPAELRESVRAEGPAHGVGELLSCPFCLAQWVATGFVAGLVFAPRATRLATATFTAVAASDFLQEAYGRLLH